MAELRYNPLIGDWVMIASHRQNRPQMPKNWCPFCPSSGKVPENYDVYKYDNDFPALSQLPPKPDDVSTDFFKTNESYGKCEVILYSPQHDAKLWELSNAHIKKLIDLWVERYEKLKEDETIKYILLFENKGEMVGVTMIHPHGQIYGYPFIPKRIELEIENLKKYYDKNNSCLLCDMLKEEIEFKERIVFKNDYFTVFIPFFSEYPYGVYILSNNHRNNIAEFTKKEKFAFAEILKNTAGMYDALFDIPFPYMMCIYNGPVNSVKTDDFFHFHVKFFPPMRSKDKQKFNASSETGAWAHCNPTCPEEKAEELRNAYKKFISIN